MGSRVLFSLVIFALVIVPAMSMDYIVGDDKMWTIDFDYDEWAKDKTFYVGDRLVFRYKSEDHNVIEVNGAQFKECEVPVNNEILFSGYDIVPLTTPGKKWYICGVAQHCLDHKMKLVINVWPQIATPAPAPAC